jgi:ADP-heptose:LPS heptosyltransferase
MYTTSSGMSMIEHDYHIPLMDLPYLFDESPDKMYGSEGYLKVDEEKLEKFRKKYIKNNKKIKVGLSYHGTKQSNATNRDIKVKEFLPLFKLKNVEFYSFQADEHAEELKDLPSDIKVYNLGKDFKDFEDTACAMKCMDIVISTDNVVMNLAGALGVKVFALFNVFSESRWYKTEGEDIGWYKTVKPFRAENFNEWTPVFDKIKNEIFNLR